jgi:hypothetical protein
MTRTDEHGVGRLERVLQLDDYRLRLRRRRLDAFFALLMSCLRWRLLPSGAALVMYRRAFLQKTEALERH